MLHNFMYVEKENFTFQEVITFNQFVSIGQPFTLSNLSQWMKLHNLLIEDDGEWENSFNWDFITIGEDDRISFNDYALDILNKVYLRYKEHYCVQLQIPYEANEKATAFVLFIEKVLKVLDYTYRKYSTLFALYDSQKSNLVAKLGRTRTGSREVSSSGSNSETTNTKSTFNDTPQNKDIIAALEDDQFVNELNKGSSSSSGSTSSSGADEYSESEQWDNATMMARLSEIEKEYSMLWKKWLNEFDGLFIEEVNY